MGIVYLVFVSIYCFFISLSGADDILGCGGFIKSHVPLDFSKIEIGLYTKGGILKEKTECAPTNGYYFLPLYEKGEYTLKVHPPPGWSFEPSEKELLVDGTTDLCSLGQDINFSFNGFGIAGQIITAGQKQGPSGIAVQLINEKGEIRSTITGRGGDFSFTPVIPGKYTVKASHPRWKLDPEEAVVQVKEGNTALPVGVLTVKGYDVKGTITAFGDPIPGLYVMLFSNQIRQKFKVEGCNTALLQGVKDSPICHTTTDALGVFTFGIVPAGEYKLVVLRTSPGQTEVTYNVKPDEVPFVVKHESLFIKEAFEITGFNVVGIVNDGDDFVIPKAQILMDNAPITTSDGQGTFLLTALRPGTYTITAQHSSCKFESLQLKVASHGVLNPARVKVSAWRVCGFVVPPPQDSRKVIITPSKGDTIYAEIGAGGKWCKFLSAGTYTTEVEVIENDKMDGLQYFPLVHKVRVHKGTIDDIKFSQLKATVRGRVSCIIPRDCEGITVTLKMGDKGSAGTMTTTVKDGEYTFTSVLPGAVVVEVAEGRWCWRRAAAALLLDDRTATVPPLEQTAYAVLIDCNYPVQVQYKSATYSGTLEVEAGSSRHCLPSAETYTLTPVGCHRFQPETVTVNLGDDTPSVTLNAVAHSNTIRLLSPVSVSDLSFSVEYQGRTETTPPVQGKQIETGEFEYTHTIYLAEGETARVSASSSELVVAPAAAVGGAACARAPDMRARRGSRVRGRLDPPVEGAVLMLKGDDVLLTQTTGPDGTYSFGPLDASKQYTVTAEKESYVFSERDENGVITASKLGEIHVTLVDAEDGTPLQGGVVSVSGGAYRRTQAAGAAGRLAFSALQPGHYYVKPLLAEYRFQPPAATHRLLPAAAHHLTLQGVRVAWSWSGVCRSAGGAGWRGALLVAAPADAADAACAPAHAHTDHAGAFRIRGLLPECTYKLELKTADNPELKGLRIVKAPAEIQVKDKKDVTGVVVIAMQPQQVTDATVLVYSPNFDHYKTLRLSLALENTPTTNIYTTKIDASGYSSFINPGLMYTLPRLPADNSSYVVKIESSLSKSTHNYEEQAFYFTADGSYKHFVFQFTPKVKLSSQELKHTPVGAAPLLLAGALAYWQRARIAASL